MKDVTEHDRPITEAPGFDITPRWKRSSSASRCLKNADLSTFLHESGHFYLEVLADIASQPNAPGRDRGRHATSSSIGSACPISPTGAR
jgi:hypothetical protein